MVATDHGHVSTVLCCRTMPVHATCDQPLLCCRWLACGTAALHLGAAS